MPVGKGARPGTTKRVDRLSSTPRTWFTTERTFGSTARSWSRRQKPNEPPGRRRCRGRTTLSRPSAAPESSRGRSGRWQPSKSDRWGRTVLLRNTVEGQVFWTPHRHQAVYHGPVVYPDDPYGRLERAFSDLVELLLLLVFIKRPAYRAQREYRFASWMETEPSEERVDLKVSPALLQAMRKGRPEPEGSEFVAAGVEESPALVEIGGPVLQAPECISRRCRRSREATQRSRHSATRRAAAGRWVRNSSIRCSGQGTAGRGRWGGRRGPARGGRRRVACGTDRAFRLRGVRRWHRGRAGERRELHRDHACILWGQADRGNHRCGAGRDVRAQDQRWRHASRVHGSGRPGVRAGPEEAAGGSWRVWPRPPPPQLTLAVDNPRAFGADVGWPLLMPCRSRAAPVDRAASAPPPIGESGTSRRSGRRRASLAGRQFPSRPLEPGRSETGDDAVYSALVKTAQHR